MSPRGRPRKLTRPIKEKTPFITKPEPDQKKFPYEKGQICADVKIVEINPEVERSIGFVYARRGIIKDEKGRVVNTTGILQGQWQEEIHWMTIPDFKSFVKAQLDNGQVVRGGM